MKVRNDVSGVAMVLAMALSAGCSSSKSAGGTGGSGSGGRAAGTGGSSAATGGSGTGGAVAGTGGAVAGTGGAVAGTGGAGGAGGAAGAATCGPFANGGAGGLGAGGAAVPAATMSFFVTSQTNMTGNLGGLVGADTRCSTLATAAGITGKTWHAYLSVEHDPANTAVAINAKDRIGTGPWFNARGVMVAANLTALHARTGDPAVFIDEHGAMINGQWTGSLGPVQHDVMTGSNADGTVAVGKTCVDWTSELGAPDAGADAGSFPVARVGHTDGFGPMCSQATTPNDVTSWNSAHDNAGCNDTGPRGGSGRIYCFAVN